MTRRHDEAGSMPLVILATIVVMGLVTTLTMSVLTSQRLTRFDQRYMTAFHGADAGVQAALAQIRAIEEAGTGETSLSGSDTTGSVDYSYTAELVDRQWRIKSQGTASDETTRYLEATADKESRFFLAAFGKTLVGFKGGNVASSYDGGTTVPTGRGAVGTNGAIELNGSLSYDPSTGECTGNTCIDEMHLFGETAECSKTAANCAQIEGTFRENREPDPYIPPTQFIEDALATCSPETAYRTSTYVHPTLGGNVLVGGEGSGPEGAYCFTSMTFDQDTTIDASSGPVVVYVQSDIQSSNGVKINCEGCEPFTTSVTDADIESMLASNPPNAYDFQIYSVGRSITLGNHSHIASGVYAPNASCHGNPSNAQGYIYGSMVCNDINNQGGWSFWYDERLDDVAGSTYQISGIREESASTTSF